MVGTRGSLVNSISEIQSGKYDGTSLVEHQFLGIICSRFSALPFVHLVLPSSHLTFFTEGRTCLFTIEFS